MSHVVVTVPDISIQVEHERRELQAIALYASIVSRAYERLVESQEPEEAMRGAIEKAEEVVRVWEKVVQGR